MTGGSLYHERIDMSRKQKESAAVISSTTKVKELKSTSEEVLATLDQPSNRGGRRLTFNTPDGQITLWRDEKGWVTFKFKRPNIDKKEELVVHLLPCKSKTLKTSDNIQKLTKFLGDNEVLASYLELLNL
jgi:hypothetical protein